MQSVPSTTNVVSSNPAHCEVYLIQHYVIKFVSDLRFLYQNWTPRYNWHIVESGVKHHTNNHHHVNLPWASIYCTRLGLTLLSSYTDWRSSVCIWIDGAVMGVIVRPSWLHPVAMVAHILLPSSLAYNIISGNRFSLCDIT
jgi:hypothetical protein